MNVTKASGILGLFGWRPKQPCKLWVCQDFSEEICHCCPFFEAMNSKMEYLYENYIESNDSSSEEDYADKTTMM